jgi:hypothetical protein
MYPNVIQLETQRGSSLGEVERRRLRQAAVRRQAVRRLRAVGPPSPLSPQAA